MNPNWDLFEFELNFLFEEISDKFEKTCHTHEYNIDVTKEFRKYKKFELAVCYFRKRNEYNVMPGYPSITDNVANIFVCVDDEYDRSINLYLIIRIYWIAFLSTLHVGWHGKY